MSTSISFYTHLTQQVTIYSGLFILTVGLVGGVLNIIVFLSLRTFRHNSCGFYLTLMSFANLLHLTTALFPHIVSYGFGIDWPAQNGSYCKARFYFFQLFLLTSLTCISLATIDQFLATCFNPLWHRWSNIKVARNVIAGFLLCWLLHGIPFSVFYNPTTSASNPNQSACAITNGSFQTYFSFGFVLVLMGVLPLTVMTLFGSLAYHNVQNLSYRTVPLVRRELDKQLTRMVLMHVIYNVVVLSPYVIVTIVTFYLTANDQTRFFRIAAANVHNFYFAVGRPFARVRQSMCGSSESVLHLRVRVETVSASVQARLRQHPSQTSAATAGRRKPSFTPPENVLEHRGTVKTIVGYVFCLRALMERKRTVRLVKTSAGLDDKLGQKLILMRL